MILFTEVLMKMKLFVTDLDGTLLNSDHELTENSKNTLKKAMSMGIPVCIATGRSYRDILQIFSDFEEQPYIISSNGASLYDEAGNKLHGVSIPKNQVRDIVNYLKAHHLQFEVADDDYTYVTKWGIDLLKKELEDVGAIDQRKKKELENDVLGIVLSQGNLRVVSSVDDILEKITAVNSISSISAYLNKIKQAMENFTMDKRIRTFSSWKYNFEMTNRDTSKGIALKVLCEKLGISLEDVVAVGDNYNDLSMLKIAGHKVAMSNAVENVKSLADEIIGSNDEESVALFLQKRLDTLNQ